MKMGDTPHKLLAMIMHCFPAPRRTAQPQIKATGSYTFVAPFRHAVSGPASPSSPPPRQRTGTAGSSLLRHGEPKRSLLPFVPVLHPRPRLLPGSGELAAGRRAGSATRLGEGRSGSGDAVPGSRCHHSGHAGRVPLPCQAFARRRAPARPGHAARGSGGARPPRRGGSCAPLGLCRWRPARRAGLNVLQEPLEGKGGGLGSCWRGARGEQCRRPGRGLQRRLLSGETPRRAALPLGADSSTR